jgi:uncharacterized protein
MANLINWLEIPVKDMNRAKEFYETALNATISIDGNMSPDYKMGFIQTPGMQMSEVGGALVEGTGYEPGTNTTLIYFHANEIGGVEAVLNRAEQAGGTVIQPRALITEEIGYFGLFTDCEGNKLGVHGKN